MCAFGNLPFRMAVRKAAAAWQPVIARDSESCPQKHDPLAGPQGQRIILAEKQGEENLPMRRGNGMQSL